MNVIVSNSSDVPLYVQIKEQIKGAILKGELEDGELLPSIRNFANDDFRIYGQSGIAPGFQATHHRTGFAKGCS